MTFSRHRHPRGTSLGWVVVVCLTLALAGLLVDGQSAYAKKRPKPKTLIKFATLAPEGSTWMKIMHALDDEVREKTENRVGFKFYPGGVQGDEKDVLRKIRNGQLHGGGFTGFGLGAVASEFRVIELPFMFRDLDEVDFVRARLDSFFYDVFKEKGYEFLGWGDVGFVYLFSNSPITNPDELRRAKMWTWSGDRLAEIFFKAFDVSPIPLALPDVLTSLQMGVVDAVYSPPLACVALQWFTRVKYMSDVPITYGFGAVLVSEKALRKVDPADMEILRSVSRKHSQILIDKTRVQNVEAIRAIEGEGVKLLAIDSRVQDEFFTTGRSAWEDGVGRLYPQDLLERVSSIVADYRENHKEAKKNP
ncbi:MAG: TRAP transporter substrate-binding protein DctP [Candidatus Latescibacterota bacterium]|nr:MAG: TRAP transporter substrate-binding protein DctP [Candidatus Latescibacterota bacterium]